MNDDTDEKWIDAVEVRRRYKFSRDQLNNAIQARTFPAPMMVNGKARWHSNDLREYEFVLAKVSLSRSGRWANVEMVCEQYHVSPRTVDHWVRKGLFPPPKKIGRKRMWDQADLDKYNENDFKFEPEPEPKPTKRGRAKNG